MGWEGPQPVDRSHQDRMCGGVRAGDVVAIGSVLVDAKHEHFGGLGTGVCVQRPWTTLPQLMPAVRTGNAGAGADKTGVA